jgi:hypothetical protein
MGKQDDGPERIRAGLLGVGVPPHVVEHVLAGRLERGLYWLPVIVMFLTMIGGFVLGLFFVWRPLAALTEANAREHALRIGGLLYSTNFGVSMLIALLGWILVSGMVAAAITRASRGLLYSAFAFSILDPRSAITMRWIVKAMGGESDPERYVRRLVVGWASLLVWPTIVLAALFVVAAYRDVQAHSVFTAEGYVRAPFLPWAAREPVPWASAVEVQLGCNHVTRRRRGGGPDDHVVYKVTFVDGTLVRLDDDDLIAPISGSWLDQIEILDATLQRAGAQVRRWSWLDRDALHPACLRAYERTHTDTDYQRIVRLLRVGEL